MNADPFAQVVINPDRTRSMPISQFPLCCFATAQASRADDPSLASTNVRLAELIWHTR